MSQLLEVRDMKKRFGDLSKEERKGMIEAAEGLLGDPSFREAMDKTFAEEYAKIDPLTKERFQRSEQWDKNMEDPQTRLFQKRLNRITDTLRIYREEHRPDLTIVDVAKHLGLEVDIFFSIEQGHTDPTELAGLVEAWANMLGLDAKPFKDAIPGQDGGKGRVM